MIFKYSFILVTPDCLSSAMASFLNLSYISAAYLRSHLDEKHQKPSMSKLAFSSPSPAEYAFSLVFPVSWHGTSIYPGVQAWNLKIILFPTSVFNSVTSILKLYPDSNHLPALSQATLLIETTIIFCFGYNDNHSNSICAPNMADRVILLKWKWVISLLCLQPSMVTIWLID